MIYLSYDNRAHQDGYGAQLQRIISIFLISKKLDVGYLHVDIVTKEHEFTDEILNKFNSLIEISKEEKNITHMIHVEEFDNKTYDFIERKKTEKTDILLKIKHAHRFIDSNPNIFDNHIFPQFSWIKNEKTTPDKLTVAIHIRRGDVSRNQNAIRFTPFDFYVNCLKNLTKLLENKKYEITIYSEKSISAEIVKYKHVLDNIKNLKYDIDGNVVETFVELVNSDILITSKSSFSYSASLMKTKNKGMVFYPSFWHKYPLEYICIDNPNNIFEYKLI
jgi:hypothetical protein